MKIFSKHRRKVEPRIRFGGLEFRTKIKDAANYKRMFNPANGFSIKIFSDNKFGRIAKISSAAVVLFLFYFFIGSSSFSITEITIRGNSEVAMDQIQNIIASDGNSRLFFIKKNNFIMMTKGRIEKLLTTSIPRIKAVVNYDRTWPNKVSIEIAEHTPGFIILSNGNYFLVDDEGIVIEQVFEPKDFLVVEDQLVESFARGERLPNQKLTPFILSMKKSWMTKMNSPIVLVKFPGKSSTEVQFVTQSGWSVLFDTQRSVSVQLSDLTVILSKQIKPQDLANLAYIDLRLNKWAYYCFKESPCEQKEIPTEAGATTETNVTE
jgi:hypothetical protein